VVSFADQFDRFFRAILPSPFSIAIILTIVTLVLAGLLTQPTDTSAWQYGIELLGFWQKGIWDSPLLVFAMQMMLMLVLGHTLALSPAIDSLIGKITAYASNTAVAAAMVAFFAMLMGLFNWGLGLIFGAVLARKVAENALIKGYAIHYPLIGAAGFLGMLVFHSGLSASAPVKANEPGHIPGLMAGLNYPHPLPNAIPMEATIFSPMNLTCIALLLVILTAVVFQVGKRVVATPILLPPMLKDSDPEPDISGAERLDRSSIFSRSIGVIILLYASWMAIGLNPQGGLSFLTPDYINTVLLGACILLHSSIFKFGQAMNEAILDVSSIIIQYPLYFGIMGIMRSSGLVQMIADFFAQISTSATFPIFTFLSSALINVFVPSGGGQWSLQAPVLIEASRQLDVPLNKSIMALAYGDQLTNMMQPLWALPLLGITGLKAKDVLPYTLLMMLVAMLIFMAVLFLF
jgi:short-chain fatty acids transporter